MLLILPHQSRQSSFFPSSISIKYLYFIIIIIDIIIIIKASDVIELPPAKRLTIPADRPRRSLEPGSSLIPDHATGQQLLSKRLGDMVVKQLSGPRKSVGGEAEMLRMRLGAKMFGLGQRKTKVSISVFKNVLRIYLSKFALFIEYVYS